MTMTRALMELKILNVVLKDLDSTMEITTTIKERWPEIYQVALKEGWQKVPNTYIRTLYYWMEKNNLFA